MSKVYLVYVKLPLKCVSKSNILGLVAFFNYLENLVLFEWGIFVDYSFNIE